MTVTDPRHYDVILSPVITEKATLASERNQVMFKVAKHATKPQIKEAVEKLFDVKVKRVNTHIRKGKVKAFKGTVGEQSEVKRAVVTLEEGHTIDVTTGLQGAAPWHSSLTTPSRRASASSFWSIARASIAASRSRR